MKEIGIVICNYNKEDYVVNCVASLLKQELSSDLFDIFVVDNASEDASVKKLSEAFGNKIEVIVNSENMGGAGGFNRGLRHAMGKGYRYLMCVDNDVVFDKAAVGSLYHFMEEHKEVGVAGSKVLFMDHPDNIWSFGGTLKLDTYRYVDEYRNRVDDSSIPAWRYCDCVPACSLIVRQSVAESVGIMQEDNFIYMDDMEWCHRIQEAGYKVALCGHSKIWHKCGGRNAGDTFVNYYMWRNRLHFFLGILKKEELDAFADTILDEMFGLVYSCSLKKEDGVIKSVMYAFNDAVNGVRGKAPDYKIFKRNSTYNRVQDAVGDATSLLIEYNGRHNALRNILNNIAGFNKSIQVTVCADDVDEKFKQQFPECGMVSEYNPESYDCVWHMCGHVFRDCPKHKGNIYIDGYCNILFTDADIAYAQNYDSVRELFVLSKKEFLMSH